MGIGRVQKLCIFTEKGRPGIEKEQIKMVENGGIEGDRHCHEADKQVSLLTNNAREWMQVQEVKGLCFKRFKANLVLDAEEGSNAFLPGAQLRIGDAVLEITQEEKECFAECPRFREGMPCMLKKDACFAKTVKAGRICVGDEAEYEYNWKRYERQILVPGIGKEEQERLKASSVLVIGAGGLGCPVLTALSEAGVGRISIVDGDVIEATNLNRQFLYGESDIGKNKAECAADWIRKFRPDCKVSASAAWISEENVQEMIKDHDIIIAAVDNISARMLLNRAAQTAGTPFIDGAIDGFYGTVTAVLSENDPCLACLNPEGKEAGHISSSLGTTTMIVGALEAQFAIQYLAGVQVKSGTVLSYDGVYGSLEEVEIQKDPKCRACGI